MSSPCNPEHCGEHLAQIAALQDEVAFLRAQDPQGVGVVSALRHQMQELAARSAAKEAADSRELCDAKDALAQRVAGFEALQTELDATQDALRQRVEGHEASQQELAEAHKSLAAVKAALEVTRGELAESNQALRAAQEQLAEAVAAAGSRSTRGGLFARRRAGDS